MTATLAPPPEPSLSTAAVTIGSLSNGHAGLDMGVAAALGGNADLAWVADNDPQIARLLAKRFPDSSQLSDLSEGRWSQVQPVDVITAGFPCQDVSAAGRGAEIEKGERSGVWKYVIDAVRHARLRPHAPVLRTPPIAHAPPGFCCPHRWPAMPPKAARDREVRAGTPQCPPPPSVRTLATTALPGAVRVRMGSL